MRTLKAVARMLARSHRKADPQTKVIRFFPSAKPDEVCLLEVSAAIPYTGEIMPFRFGAEPSSKVDYPSVVILIDPKEWKEVKKGELKLPPGWDLKNSEEL